MTDTTDRAALIARLREHGAGLCEEVAAMLEADGKAQQLARTSARTCCVAGARTTNRRHLIRLRFNAGAEPREASASGNLLERILGDTHAGQRK